jgi:acetyltransferase-like isoleucine patch superfamily enzyme
MSIKTKIRKIIFPVLIKPLYPECDFKFQYYSIKEMFFYITMQKIIGFNRHIPWPVHFTSVVKDYKKIKSKTEPVGFAPHCYIDARNGIIIEENVNIAPKVSIISMNHDIYDFNKYKQDKSVIIKKNSWLATGCIILSGVELGEHTIVAAGSVVTKSFPEGNQLIGGIPAKIIKKLDVYKA